MTTKTRRRCEISGIGLLPFALSMALLGATFTSARAQDPVASPIAPRSAPAGDSAGTLAMPHSAGISATPHSAEALAAPPDSAGTAATRLNSAETLAAPPDSADASATLPNSAGPPGRPSDSLGRSSLVRSLRSSWSRGWGGTAPSASEVTFTYPGAPSRIGPGGGLTYYPSGGVRTVDGLGLSQQQAFLYGVRRFELNRRQTALKGADLAGSLGLFAGAMASSFGWLSESEGLWLAGGAAALGAAYGAVVGYESTAFREEWRWPRTLEDDPGIHIRARAR